MMKTKAHYTRIIYWSDEDGKYLGKLPELTPYPCVSGQTVEEVNAELDQAEEALLDALGDDLPARGIRVVVPGSRRNWIAKTRLPNCGNPWTWARKNLPHFWEPPYPP